MTMDEQAARAKVSTIADRLGKPIDEGIRETCVWLLVAGFEIVQSCEGHAGYPEPYPWVQFEAADNTPAGNAPHRERMASLLKEGCGLVMEDHGMLGAFRVVPSPSLRNSGDIAANRERMLALARRAAGQ